MEGRTCNVICFFLTIKLNAQLEIEFDPLRVESHARTGKQKIEFLQGSFVCLDITQLKYRINVMLIDLGHPLCSLLGKQLLPGLGFRL